MHRVDERVRFVGGRAYDAGADALSVEDLPKQEGWAQVFHPGRRDAPGIGLRKVPNSELIEAGFTLLLTTVSSRGVEEWQRLQHEGKQSQDLEADRSRAMNALISSFGPRDAVSIIYELHHDADDVANVRVTVHGTVLEAEGERCVARAKAFFHDLCIALAAGADEFGFQSLPEPAWVEHPSGATVLRVVPASVEVPTTHARAAGFDRAGPRPRVRMPLPAADRPRYLNNLAPAMLAAPHPVRVQIRLTRALYDQAQFDLVQAAAGQLIEGDLRSVALVGASAAAGTLGAEALVTVRQAIEPWFAQPSGAWLEVSLASQEPIPVSLAHLIGSCVFQGRSFHFEKPDAVAPAELVDLSSLVLSSSTFPPLLPSPASLAALGYARHFPVVRFAIPRDGIVLGDIPMPFADAEVRFAQSDRSQHCYVIGATGTGKSTLLRRMIEQDIAGGDGLALIDPHGDLYEQMLSAIPARRKNDVVLLDFTDNEHFVGLNFLECVSAHPDIEKNFIVHQLAEIFWSLYAHVPESMGPAFLQYMRNAVTLVMEDPGKDLTLLEVPLVFADQTFRNYLLAHCKDEQVTDFWQGTAGRTTGDSSLANMAAYITNKFTEFTQNQLVRMVVGQSRSSIDFRRIMDERRILLVNLSKGLLSESDSRFLGMLVTGRLFAAAMARANVPRARRTPFYVYMDEFQNFTTAAVTKALAEMRKFGLALTLAHQNLGQLPEQLRESALANIGSRIILRVGAMDAKRLAEFVSPHFGERDLVALPDHHAVARIKVDNVPSPAFAMRTRRLEGGTPTPAQQAITKDVIARSRAKYCRTVPETRNDIAWRRARHVLRLSPAALGFSATACDFLKAHNVRVLSDLAGPDSPVMQELATQKLPTNDAALVEKVKAALRAQAERENT
jgi:hypothetical protein